MRTSPKEAECCEGSFNGSIARDESTLDADGIRRQGKSTGGYAARRSLAGAVRHQAILRIGLIQKILKGKALQHLELSVGKGALCRHHTMAPAMASVLMVLL